MLQSRHLPEDCWRAKCSWGWRSRGPRLCSKGSSSPAGQSPRCHAPRETQQHPSPWDLCCWFEREQQRGLVWCGGTKSWHKIERIHLLPLTNARIYSEAVLARSFSHTCFFDAKDLLSGFDSSLRTSNTLKISNRMLKYLWPIADLSKAQEQPFLLADADAGNS